MRQSASAVVNPHVAERDYLRPDEVNRLIGAAGKRGRNPLRDTILLRLMYRHGLRCQEARTARWSQFDLDNPGTKTFHVRRIKGSEDSTHTLDRDEVAGLRKLRDATDSPYLFVSERGGPMSADMVARVVAEAAEQAGIGFHVHPHSAAPFGRLHACQRRYGHAADPGASGASGHPEHDPLHETVSKAAGRREGALNEQAIAKQPPWSKRPLTQRLPSAG